jgi:hypothetical protein
MPTITYTPIATRTLASTTSQVDFTSIPSTYTDLIIVMSASGSSYVNSVIRFNGDTSTNYSATRMYGNGSTATSARFNTETFSYIGDLTTTICTTIVQIQNYANTTTFKSFISRSSAASGGVDAWAGLWRKSPIAAITNLSLISASGASFAVGSTFTLYGIKAGS